MTPESSLGVTTSDPGAGANLATASPPAAPGSGAPSEQNATGVTSPVQGEQSQTQDDPLAGLPTLTELEAQVAQNVPGAKGMAQLRSAYEARNTQFTELESKYKPLESFSSHLERFEKPEDLQQIVDFREKLYGWEKDDKGQLVPGTAALVQELTATAPERADFLSADLLNGMTRDPDTGRTLSRMDLALEAIAEDPARRAKALQILGGVEPNSIAPTWQPTAEELAAIPEELQEIYKKLPYDKRQSLNASDPEVVKDYLEDQKFKADVRDRDAATQARETKLAQQREQYIQREAENAGNQLVEQQFGAVFTGFAKNLCEKTQYIKPLDPQSDEAKAMDPAQVAATNQKIEKVNRGANMFAATVVAALSHPETSFLAKEFAREIGITDDVLQKLDGARLEFAANNRNFGNLRFRAGIGQNGNGDGLPQDVGMLQSAAQRSQRSLMLHGNAVAGPIQALLSELFALQATSHNQTLNGAATARPGITGSAYDPTQVATQRPAPQSEAEIRARNRADIERLAAR